jgi:outer membrane receptor protein involved in Fe transport
VVPQEYRAFFSPTFNQGSKSISRIGTTFNTLDYSATATFTPTRRLGSTSSVGLQYYRTFARSEALSGQQFPAPGVTTVSGTAIRAASEGFVEDVTLGVYAQQQFSWNDRLFLTGAIRADDNSAFGADFDLVTYPKVSASWVISEEPFWKLGFVNSLKLRGAYGESGQQPSAFAAIRTYDPITGEADAPAATPQSPGNPTLGPERAREVEIGFEASLLNDRLGVDFTYYDRKTRDAIIQRAVAPSSGYTGAQFINAGSISNKGFEVLARGRAVEARNVLWDLSLNLARNKNKVVDLGIDANFIAVGWIPNRHQEGFPLDAYFRKRIVSAELQNGNPVNVLCDGGTGQQGVEPGGAAVPCAQAPYLYLGKPYFDWSGAFTSTLTLFSRLTLGTVLDFRYGGQMFESLNWWNCSSLLNHEIVYYPERYDPKYVAECRTGLDVIGTTRIQDAGYTKLRELSLNYVLPARWARHVGASRASVTLAGRNLHTWTGFDGLDPETFTSVNWLLSAHTELVLPLPRTIMATVNVEF